MAIHSKEGTICDDPDVYSKIHTSVNQIFLLFPLATK